MGVAGEWQESREHRPQNLPELASLPHRCGRCRAAATPPCLGLLFRTWPQRLARWLSLWFSGPARCRRPRLGRRQRQQPVVTRHHQRCTPSARRMLAPVALAQLPEAFQVAVKAIRSKVPAELQTPAWGIICGSGLGGLADSLHDKVVIPYSTIPGFPQTTVEGHKSELALGFLSQGEKRVPVVACLGRFHGYEGFAPQEIVFPTRLFRALGAQAIVVTNAAGGLNPNYEVGTIVAMHDHISFPGLNVRPAPPSPVP